MNLRLCWPEKRDCPSRKSDPPGSDLAGLEADPGERLDQFLLFVGEV